jgi:PadR family transcriptional regulator, regulatory protein PadR
MKKRTNPPFLNGVPEMLILHVLSRHAMHGYELVQAIKAETDAAFEFGEGCIYPILHRLEAQGHLHVTRETVTGRRRLVYRLTNKGKKQFCEAVACWQRVNKAIMRALQGGEHGEPALA